MRCFYDRNGKWINSIMIKRMNRINKTTNRLKRQYKDVLDYYDENLEYAGQWQQSNLKYTNDLKELHREISRRQTILQKRYERLQEI